MEEKTLKERLLHIFIISIFCSLYFLVATISMINSVAFFDLSHSGLMSWSLAIGFEIGAAASLAAIIILDKTNKTMVWGLFLLLTSFQMMANSFHAFINLENYMGWIELFGLEEAEPIYQKRILAIVSGAILPLIALGFIKSLVDYIRPEQPEESLKDETAIAGYSADIDILENSKKHFPSDDIKEVKDEPIKDTHTEAITIPVTIGEVQIAPETVNTDNAVADIVEEPVQAAHITPVGDPIVIPTSNAPRSNKVVKPALTSRPFIKG